MRDERAADRTGRTVTLEYADSETADHSLGDVTAITGPAVTESALDAVPLAERLAGRKAGIEWRNSLRSSGEAAAFRREPARLVRPSPASGRREDAEGQEDRARGERRRSRRRGP